MADEPITTPPPAAAPPPADPPPGVNPVEARITDLSSKVKTASEERDAAKAAADAAQKKAAFAEGFLDVVVANPAAKDHKAEIEAKVSAGYTVQDATYAVLGAAGKLGTPQVARTPITGGSAATPITIQGNKELENMSREELRAAFLEEVKKGNIA